jgi:hypothetical protein
MDTTSFYFEPYNIRYKKLIGEEQEEDINKKMIYSEMNNEGISYNPKKE